MHTARSEDAIFVGRKPCIDLGLSGQAFMDCIEEFQITSVQAKTGGGNVNREEIGEGVNGELSEKAAIVTR